MNCSDTRMKTDRSKGTRGFGARVRARACPPFVSCHGERNPTENPKLLSRGGKRGVDAHRWFLAVLKGRDRFGRNPSTVQKCEFLSLHVDVAARGPSVECDYGESDVRAVVLWVFASKRMETSLNLSCFWQLGRVSFEDPWVETRAYLEENRDVVA